MRALFSWDVDRSDPQFAQIIVELAAALPQGRVTTLTNCTARVDRTTVREFNTLFQALTAVADHYPNRVFFTFSLHSESDPVWGKFRPVAVAPVAASGPAPGDGE